MKPSNSTIRLTINPDSFLKDPESSVLGNRIIQGGIELIDEIGFEAFTFKKLASHIQSTEASIYRYFESKHKLLVYLTVWYWAWVDYRLILATTNIDCPKDRLMRAIQVVTEAVQQDSNFLQVNEIKLHRIILSESSKIYLNKNVETDNSSGFFTQYKNVVARLSDIILEVNPTFKYPHMLVTTVIEGAHHQRYFAEHLPRLTDIIKNEDAVTTFYKDLVIKSICD